MRVTPSEEYGLRCLLQLAREHEKGRALTLPEIAAREGLPVPNTAKLLRRLRLAGIVTSARGRTGGYTLARHPREIDLAQALAALDGPMFVQQDCAHYTGLEPVCVRTSDCSVRSLWIGIEHLMRSALAKINLADLVSMTEEIARRHLGTAWEREGDLQTAWLHPRPIAISPRQGNESIGAGRSGRREERRP